MPLELPPRAALQQLLLSISSYVFGICFWKLWLLVDAVEAALYVITFAFGVLVCLPIIFYASFISATVAIDNPFATVILALLLFGPPFFYILSY